MNKLITKLFLILFIITGLFYNAFAQAPEGIVYQAEARDNRGKIIANSNLDVMITIFENNVNIVWEGLHNVRTNDYGMFVLIIGEGIPQTADFFEEIKWESHTHFLNVQVKKTNKTVYVDMGTTQLLSVPYALHAKTAKKAIIDEVDDADADPSNELQNILITDHELTISDGNSITLPDEIDDADADPTNELITDVTLNGTDLEITDAGGTKTVELNSFSSPWIKNDPDIYFNTGKVGVGTASPTSTFQVNGWTTFYGGAEIRGLSGDPNHPTAELGISRSNSSSSAIVQFNSDPLGRWQIGLKPNDMNFHFTDTYFGTDRLVLEVGTGNVGIGTTSPDKTLHIFKDNESFPLKIESNTGSTGIQLTTSSTAASIGTQYTTGNGDQWYNYAMSDYFTFRVQADNKQVLTLKQSGNVGIGTTTPEEKLHVAGNMRLEGTFRDEDGNTGSPGQLLSSTGLATHWTDAPNGDFSNDGEAAGGGRTLGNTDNYALGFKTNDIERLRISDNGNVGIGTTDPSLNLDVVMDQGIASIAATTYRIGEFGAGQFIGQAARGTQDAPSAVQENDFLASFNGRGYGDTDFSDRPRGRLGFVAAENWTDESQGAYLVLTTTPIGTTANTERFRITSEGNVGIGTSDPNERLHIAGNMKLEGTLGDQYGNIGSAGQILSSTETGTEWTSPTIADFSNGGEIGNADRTLGNTDNYSLGFKTNNTTRFNIFNDGGLRFDGNLGININPDAASSINKSIYLNASKTYSNAILNLSGHNSGTIYLESRRGGFTPETSGKKWTISAGSGSVLDLDKFNIYNPDDGSCFTIRDGGKIGIGITEPDEKLHVAGNMRLDGTFEDQNGNAGSGGQILSSTGIGTEWIAAPSVGTDADWTISGNDMFSTMSGNVGIGTTNPHGKLEVYGYNPGVNTTVGDFVVDTDNKKVYVGRLSSTSYDNSDFIIRNRLGHETFVFSGNGNYISMGNYNGSQEQMRVVFDGNTFGVGIGTTTPRSKLQVNGGVQIANDGGTATADKAGTLRYWADSNNSYVEMCMQTGASTYAWVVVKQNTW